MALSTRQLPSSLEAEQAILGGMLVYPKVVGGSVGLPPLYTLVSAMIGGRLFGILGIIFFIPLVAVSLELIRTDAENRLNSNA